MSHSYPSHTLGGYDPHLLHHHHHHHHMPHPYDSHYDQYDSQYDMQYEYENTGRDVKPRDAYDRQRQYYDERGYSPSQSRPVSRFGDPTSAKVWPERELESTTYIVWCFDICIIIGIQGGMCNELQN